jgi:hypothetical protein
MNKNENIVWAFGYNPCIHESATATVSLHRTKRGAEIAMEFHKDECRKEYEHMDKEMGPGWQLGFGMHEEWDVFPIEIKD